MPQKKLNAYCGTLSAASLAEGMNAAAAQARRLLADAQTLLNSGSFSTACSIAILAIEETGKTSILRGLAVASSPKEAAANWKSFRTHTSKNVAWILPQMLAQGANRMLDFQPMFEDGTEHPYLLDQVKQIGFYTDCLGRAHWSIPAAVISEDLARSIFKIAEILVGGLREYTAKEIELWIEHMGPVWHDPLLRTQALVSWFAAMQAHGLAPSGRNEMEQFLNEGFRSKTVQ